MNSRIYKFDEFSLDLKKRKLLCKNAIVQLSSRAFEILLLLVKNQGEIVEKQEILNQVWADSFVEESNLVVHISALRRILGERRGERKFIETVSGRGYSFVFPVEEIRLHEKPSAAEKRSRKLSETAAPDFDSSVPLAVLPFSFTSGNADFEYLARGITQSLIDNLSQIPRLKVMAYSAVENYRNPSPDLPEIAFLLGVEKLLIGRISEYREHLEISVELIDARDKRYIWGTEYNCKFTDIFEVRREISLIIAEKLQLRLNNLDEQNLAKPQTSEPEAYKFYLKGNYFLGGNSTSKNRAESLRSALKCFERALEKDSRYALAYTGIGYVYYRLFNINLLTRDEAYTNCKKFLQLALNFDPNLSEARTLCGIIQFFFERDLREAEKSFQRAVEINPNNSIAYHYQSVLFSCFGRAREAIALQNRAIQLDPVSIFLNGGLTNRFFFTGDYGKAIIQAEETLELDGELLAPFFILALSYAQLGMYDEALKNIEKAVALQPIEEMFAAQSYIYARAGQPAKAKEILKKLLHKSAEKQIDFADVATVFAALGEPERAFEYLEKAFQKGDSNIVLLAADPRFETLHADARFAHFLHRLNLR